MGLWAGTALGIDAALYYLARLRPARDRLLRRRDLRLARTAARTSTTTAGSAGRHPWLAAGFTILLLAQAGVPFTTGFLAKLAVLEAAIGELGAAGVVLGVVAMLATAIGGYYYLRVVVLTYATPLGRPATPPAPSSPGRRAPSRASRAVGAGILVEDDRDGPSAEHLARAPEPASPRPIAMPTPTRRARAGDVPQPGAGRDRGGHRDVRRPDDRARDLGGTARRAHVARDDALRSVTAVALASTGVVDDPDTPALVAALDALGLRAQRGRVGRRRRRLGRAST